MAPYCYRYPVRIRFSHCDPAGIVFFPQYLVLMNTMLEDWFTDGLGVGYADLLGRRRIGTPTVRLEVDFTAISRFGDEVVFVLEVEKLGHASLTLLVQCHGNAPSVDAQFRDAASSVNSLRFRARQVLVFTDLTTHKPVAIPDDVRAAMVACTSS